MRFLVVLLVTQQPLLVSVELQGVGSVMVEARLDADSTLRLPAADVYALVGVAAPPASWVTPADLRRAFPSLVVEWLPRELRVVIVDDLGVLPATRRRREAQQRQARGAAPLTFTRSGPFAAVAVDELSRYVLDLGFSHRGVLAVAARTSSERGTTWTVGLVRPHFFASVSGAHLGIYQRPEITTATARLGVGPVWLAPTYDARRQRLEVDALVALRGVHLFLSSRDVWLLTFKSPAGDLQFGQSRGLYAARASFGPVPASPFGFPLTR